MPIYEYLCPVCNRVFSFLIKSVCDQRLPVCPKCGGQEMRRRVSRFAVTGTQRKSRTTQTQSAHNTTDSEAGTDRASPDPLENPQVEQEMMRLMNEAEGIDENDPRQLGRLMRRMTEISGEPVEPQMEEAMRRLEAGEDPEKIEDDLGDLLGAEDGGDGTPGDPSYDPGLYDL